MSKQLKTKHEMDLDPIWLKFSQDSLESRYRQYSLSENIKPLALLYIISALLVTLPALYLALHIDNEQLIYLALSLAAMPLIAGAIQSASILKDIKHKQINKVSMLFVLLINMTSAILGLIASWFAYSMAWAPIGPVIFCFGLALWLPSVKGVSTVLFVTALINTIAIFVGGHYLQLFGIELTLWGWFLLCLLPMIPFSRQRNIDRRRLFLIASQLKESENTLHNESFERRRLWHLLKQSVQTDPITRLFEHQYFHKLCQLELERAKRYQRPMTLLVIHLQNLKQIEKEQGETALSKVEMGIATMLRQQLRQQDIIGRVSGNDFGVLLPETGVNEAQIVVHRLKSVPVEQELTGEQQGGKVIIEVGLASLALGAKSKDVAAELDLMFKKAANEIA